MWTRTLVLGGALVILAVGVACASSGPAAELNTGPALKASVDNTGQLAISPTTHAVRTGPVRLGFDLTNNTKSPVAEAEIEVRVVTDGGKTRGFSGFLVDGPPLAPGETRRVHYGTSILKVEATDSVWLIAVHPSGREILEKVATQNGMSYLANGQVAPKYSPQDCDAICDNRADECDATCENGIEEFECTCPPSGGIVYVCRCQPRND
jgi:hypothetical protein